MRGNNMKRETWEIELEKNMVSIRKSSASIKRTYNQIMGLMIIVVAIELSGLFFL
tara:strand:- start:30 stop:194 length:165 start_codon:yes stop_codon:yes gene_type:complete